MTVIKRHIEALKRFRDQAEELAIDLAITEESAEIQRMNTEQLDDGMRSDKKPIRPPYSPKYAAYKKRLGLKTNVVTLRLSGDFYKSLHPKRTAPDEMEVSSNDFKAPFLTGRYGKEVLGLNEDNIDKLAARIQPKMEARLKAVLSI